MFLNGNPYLASPPVDLTNNPSHNLPGVAGGGTGPDLLINGMTGGSFTAGVITLAGDGSVVGDQAIVQTASELDVTTDSGAATDIDIFGFGAGVLIPGFGTGYAYDTIDINGSGHAYSPLGGAPDRVVADINALAIRLTEVQLDTSDTSFIDPSVPAANAQPGLIVNAGDEAVADVNGVSDDIYAAPSTLYNIQVNGNLPTLALGPDGLPLGDQLTLTSPIVVQHLERQGGAAQRLDFCRERPLRRAKQLDRTHSSRSGQPRGEPDRRQQRSHGRSDRQFRGGRPRHRQRS